MKQLSKLYPHLLAIIGFIVISLLYFYPVLQGKKIYQSDIVQYTGMAKEQNDFRATENSEPYWTNSAFGGMPTYQLGAKYPHDYIGDLDDTLRFLPRPSDYLFLYFFGFYILLLVLKIDPLKAFFGALAFGLSTYLIIILGVGHNAKAHAIAYMPMVIAGVLLVFKKRYIVGGFLTMLAVALEINANHFQMTYYLLMLLLLLGGYFSYKYIKNKDFKPLMYVGISFAVALILAMGVNATNLLATKEYADFSTRSKSDLKIDETGKAKFENSALSKEYITQYSYGIAESFNLIAPRLFGGGSIEKLSNDSSVYNFMIGYGATPEEARQFTDSYGMTYWGKQPSVAAPAYIGAIVFFLFVLGMYHDKRKIKYVFLAAALLTLILSWGKNLSLVTDFFINYIPVYDKFRAVSSIQVILELCIPVIAIMGFHSFFTTNKEKQWSSLWKATATVFALLICLFLIKGSFDFVGNMDKQLLQMFSQGQDKAFGIGFIDALKADRQSLYSADLLRSGFVIALAFLFLWLFTKNKLSQTTTVVLVGLIMVFDLFFVDKNYVGKEDFVSAREVDVPFVATPTDLKILDDKSIFRVLEVEGNLSSSRASYFHKSIGGYHAAKPKRMQELFDYQIAKNNIEVMNMLNIKYLIQTNDKGETFALPNPEANGNAWFVKDLILVNSADDEMKALNKFDSKNVAFTTHEFTTILRFKGNSKTFQKDSAATIKLTSYKPNNLIYTSNNKNEGIAVFSEMYYKDGWNVYIDEKSSNYIRADYALRAMQIPAGNHKIEFKFEPQVVKTGSTIALISTIFMFLIFIGGIYFRREKVLK